MATLTPRALRIRPMAAAVTPLPTELTTPPVQKMYLGMFHPFLLTQTAANDPTHKERRGGEGIGCLAPRRRIRIGWSSTLHEPGCRPSVIPVSQGRLLH